jgi:putative transposase
MLRDAAPDICAFAAFPQPHWRQIWSTNPLERVNVEIKRRADVVGIFANENSVLRLSGAVLLEIHDEWAVAERSYLSAASLAKLYETRQDDNPKEVERAHSELVA